MNPRKLVVLIAVLAALAAAVLAKSVLVKPAAMAPGEAEKGTPLFAEPPAAASVRKLVVYKGADGTGRIAAAKNDAGEWSLDSHWGLRGRKEAIERFIDKVRGLSGEIRSESEAVLGDFAITDERAVHVVLEPGAHVLVSPKRPSGFQNFVRLQDSPRVLAASEDVLVDLAVYAEEDEPDHKVFADLQALKIDTSRADRIEVRPPKGAPVTLIKRPAAAGEAAEWAFEPSGTPDEAKVNQYLGSVSGVYAMEAADPAGEGYGFSSSPLVRVLAGGDILAEITVGKTTPDQKGFYVKTGAEGPVFVVNDAYLEPLKKDKAFFAESE